MARKPAAPGPVIVAAARPIPLDDKTTKDAWKRRREDWQAEGWRYYDEVGEIKFAELVTANWMRKLRLFAAVQPEPDQEPIPVDDPDSPVPPQVAVTAIDAVDRLMGDEGSHGHLAANFAVNADIAGECVLVGETLADGTETFMIRSTQELSVDSAGRWIIKAGPDDRTGTPLSDNATAVRLWRPHPQWSNRPDAPMRGVLDRCDELLILSRQIRAEGRARLSRGILLVPQEASFPAADPTQSGADGNATGFDQFVTNLIAAFSAPIQDEASASAVVPLLVQCPKDLIEAWKHLDFVRPFDEATARQRDELIHRIAAGLDLPAEVLLGLGQGHVNHWTADVIDQQTFEAHLQPRAELLVTSLTKGYLRPALGADAAQWGIQVWYDASHLIGHPNVEENTWQAHDRFLISDEAARRRLGIAETDAPDPTEILDRVRRKAALRITDTGAGPSAINATEVASVRPITARSRVLTAAGAAREAKVARLGDRLATIDRTLFGRLQVAADAEVNRALEMTGATLRRKAQRDKTLAALVKRVDVRDVPARLGRDVVASLTADGRTDDAAAAIALAGLASRWDTWVTRAQAQARASILGVDDTNSLDDETIAATQERAASAGWLVLAAGITTLIGDRLFNPHPAAPTVGEFDSTTTVPAGLIREALGRAGGGDGHTLPGGAVTTTNGGVATGVATGPIMLDALATVNVTTDGWTWTVGAPERPFEPHQDLDGVSFTAWDDDVLANPGDFPPVDYLVPGDHAGCQCLAVPSLSISVALTPAGAEAA